jgi:general stress protein 26
MADERARLVKRIKRFKIAILVTDGADGFLRARPLELQHHGPGNERGEIWLSTSIASQKVKDLRANARCAVCLTDLKSTYLSLSGKAEVLTDRKLIHQMWRTRWKLFYEGPDDPDIALVHFTPEHVELLAPTAGRIGLLLGATDDAEKQVLDLK